MAVNKFLTVATGTDATVLTDAEYAALGAISGGLGFQAGVFLPAHFNKVARQTSVMCAAVAQFMVNKTTTDTTDSDGVSTLADRLSAAVAAVVTATVSTGLFSGKSTGTSDALVVDVSPNLAAYADGQIFIVTPNATNTTTTPTANMDGRGAKTIVHPDGDALTAGEIASGGKVILAYDSTLGKLVLMSPTYAWLASKFLLLAGGTMTGLLTLSGEPTSSLHAATKSYVDSGAFGSNLRWKSVYRSVGVVYQNTTPGPIAISVNNSANGSGQVYVGPSNPPTESAYVSGGTTTPGTGGTVIIPKGHYYTTDGVISIFAELRP